MTGLKDRLLHPHPSRPALLLRSIFLGVFLIFLVYATFFASWRPHSLADVKDDLDAFGPGAPVVAALLNAIGVVLLVPGFLLILATAVLFGLDAIWITLAGQTLGAILAYLIARHVGRDLLHAMLGQRLIALEKALEFHAFRTLLILRVLSILPGPFIVYAPGLVRVPLRQVFLAAIIGQIPFILVLAYLGDSVASVERPGDLLTWQFVLPFLFLMLLVLLPVAAVTAVKMVRRRRLRSAVPPPPPEGEAVQPQGPPEL